MNIDRILDILYQTVLGFKYKIYILLDGVKSVVESVNFIKKDGYMKEGIGKVSESTSILFDFLNFFKDIISGKSGGISYIFNIYNDFIKYLDSLTLLQEFLLHFLRDIYIICTFFTIIFVFFGNELMRYFDLESKISYLSILLKIYSQISKILSALDYIYVICSLFSRFGLFLDLVTFFL